MLPRGLILPLLLPSLLQGLGQGAAAPVIVLLALDQGSSVAGAAMVAAVAGLGLILGDVPSGWIIAKLGERWAVGLASVIGVCGAVLCVLAGNPAGIAVGVVLVGFSQAVSMVSRQNSVVEVAAPQHLGLALAAVAASMRAGLLAGPFLGAAIVAVAGPAGGLWIQAVAIAAAGLLMATVPDATTRGDPETIGVRAVAASHAAVLAKVGAGALVLGICRTSRSTVLPLWAAHVGLDAVSTSIIFGIGGAVDLLVSMPAGRALDILGRVPVAVASTSVFALGAAVLPLTHGPIPVAVASVILGLGNGLSNGLLMTLGADLSPLRGRVAFLGLWRTAHDLGVLGGPMMIAGVTAVVGLTAASLATAGAAGVGAVVFALIAPGYLPLRGGSAARGTSDHSDDNRCPGSPVTATISSTA